MYTIGQVAKQVNMPVSTLRYYDNEGLFPHLVRCSGIRKFSDNEIEALHIIECLKKSGLETREIKKFMELCAQGSSTYLQRHALFLRQKAAVEEEMRQLEKTLDMLRFKCWYYEQAMQEGNEDRLRSLAPEVMPAEIRQAYEHAHA